jgi:hypothetical protein
MANSQIPRFQIWTGVFVGANIETSRGLAPEPNFRLQFGIVEIGKENQRLWCLAFRKCKRSFLDFNLNYMS